MRPSSICRQISLWRALRGEAGRGAVGDVGAVAVGRPWCARLETHWSSFLRVSAMAAQWAAFRQASARLDDTFFGAAAGGPALHANALPVISRLHRPILSQFGAQKARATLLSSPVNDWRVRGRRRRCGGTLPSCGTPHRRAPLFRDILQVPQLCEAFIRSPLPYARHHGTTGAPRVGIGCLYRAEGLAARPAPRR